DRRGRRSRVTCLFGVVVAAVALARLGVMLGLLAGVGRQRGALLDRVFDPAFVVPADVALVAVGSDLFAFRHDGLLKSLRKESDGSRIVSPPRLLGDVLGFALAFGVSELL